MEETRRNARRIRKRPRLERVSGVADLYGVDRLGLLVVFYARGMSPGRKETRWRLALPSFLQKGVMIMTAYEMLSIVLMIITVAFTIHLANHK